MFNEKTHAYIAAEYYKHMKRTFGERGVKAFIHATQYYAEQRGRRMAQRAIRDGRDLTYAVYQEYGEWKPSDFAKKNNCTNLSITEKWTPDVQIRITRCPWHMQFQEMGMEEAGNVYCQYLDAAICRGFNPNIIYEVPQNLNSADFCIQIVRNANFKEGETHEKRPEYIRSFEYHCAHLFWSFAEVAEAIFLAEGKDIVQKVLQDFEKDYSSDMADVLMKYRNTNFNVCD